MGEQGFEDGEAVGVFILHCRLHVLSEVVGLATAVIERVQLNLPDL